MPKINYNDVKIIKPKKTKRFVLLKAILALLIFVGFTYFFADAFSNLLTVGDFSLSIFENSNTIKYKPKPLYALTLGKYNTIEEAEEVANVAGSWGASGYVTQISNVYYVLGSIYATKEDSEIVRSNLQLTNYNTQTITLEFSKVEFNVETITSKHKKEVLNTLNYLFEIYNQVYNISIKIDKGEITSIAGRSFLNTLKSQVKIKNIDLNKINLSYNNKQLSKICNCLTEIEESLNICVNQLLTNDYINRNVKYCLCEIVFLELNLLNNL